MIRFSSALVIALAMGLLLSLVPGGHSARASTGIRTVQTVALRR